MFICQAFRECLLISLGMFPRFSEGITPRIPTLHTKRNYLELLECFQVKILENILSSTPTAIFERVNKNIHESPYWTW